MRAFNKHISDFVDSWEKDKGKKKKKFKFTVQKRTFLSPRDQDRSILDPKLNFYII